MKIALKSQYIQSKNDNFLKDNIHVSIVNMYM